MNSFKKVAFALVATMTLGTLTVIPANATSGTSTLKVGGSSLGAGVGLTAANPASLPVPADNSVDSADALQISISGLLNNTTATANVVNGRVISALATPTAPVVAASGSTSLSLNTGTGTTLDFYVFTTSATDGAVSVSIGGNTTTYYFRASAGPLNSITLAAPATAAAGTIESVTVAGFDVFGNPKGGATITLQVITNTSTTTGLVTDSFTSATTTLGAKTTGISIPASGNVTLVATASVAAPVLGLATPVSVVIKTITVRDLLAELKSAQDALAAERAARAADKIAADTAAIKAASDLAIANAEVAKLKSEAVLANADADKALADSEKALSETKATFDKAVADFNAQLAALTASLDKLKKRYNVKAKKFKFKPVA